MKSNNQYNKKPKYLKQVTVNLWSACLGCCFFVLLLFSSVSFSDSSPGFCWALNGSSSCEFADSSGGSDDYYQDFDIDDVDSDQSFLTSPSFQFRSDCRDDCGGKDWKLDFVDFKYNDSSVSESDFNDRDKYILSTSFNIPDFGEDDNNFDWAMNNEINGGGDKLNKNGMSGNMALTLKIMKKVLKGLDAGKHKYTVVLKGYDSDESFIRYLNYHFYIDVPSNKQVLISRLQNMNLRTFPEHMPYYTQNICIHASGDHKFSIRAEGADKNQSNFILSSSSNTISYIPLFGEGNDKPENSLMAMNGDTENKTFFGHDHQYCNGGTNMTLAVRLSTTFEELSVKPAGNYTDTLTLIVEAK